MFADLLSYCLDVGLELKTKWNRPTREFQTEMVNKSNSIYRDTRQLQHSRAIRYMQEDTLNCELLLLFSVVPH